MPPNLSFENLTVVLSALGVSTLVACAGNQPQPVSAREVPPVSSSTPAPATGQSSCSASGCGGKKAPEGTAAASPVAASGAAMAPAAVDAPAAAAAASPAATTEKVAVKPDGTSPASPERGRSDAASLGTAKKVPVQKAVHGEASCGAGTCSNDTKKKIW